MDMDDMEWRKYSKNKVVNTYLNKKNRKNSLLGYDHTRCDDHQARRTKRFEKRSYAKRKRQRMKQRIMNDQKGVEYKCKKVSNFTVAADIVDKSDYNLTINCRTKIYGNRFYK